MSDETSKKVERVDAHQHFWVYSKEEYGWMDSSMGVLMRDYLPDNLLPILEEYKIDGSIAVQARPSLEENEFLLKLSQMNPKILGIVGWLDFCGSGLEEKLERYNSYQVIKGYRAMVQDMPKPSKFLKSEPFNKGVAILQNTGKLYELLIKENDLPAAVSFCQRHDRAAIVLCHMGKPIVPKGDMCFWEEHLKELAALSHVSVKISGIVTEAYWGKWTKAQLVPYLVMALEAFGPERVLFGSDWPVCLLSASVKDVYSLACEATNIFSDHEKELFWGKNAVRIYKL
ncbi:MAG: amidohydrolase family protein [Deltaproteobacteria bacterium]|jgi:L-fuconolactonase|nr:amidohydrolase family protein [Deltaproteobacteria bacterium]